jgi:hypothetical protein
MDIGKAALPVGLRLAFWFVGFSPNGKRFVHKCRRALGNQQHRYCAFHWIRDTTEPVVMVGWLGLAEALYAGRISVFGGEKFAANIVQGRADVEHDIRCITFGFLRR